MNFYKHHLGDYALATAHLSWDEDCAYRRLLSVYYRDERPIPADLKLAARVVRAETKRRARAVKNVLDEFFVLQSDGWHNKRADEELASDKAFIEKQRANGKASAAKRSLNGGTHLVEPSVNGGSTVGQPPTPTPTPTPNLNPIHTHSDSDLGGSSARARKRPPRTRSVCVEDEKSSGWRPPSDEEWHAGK